MKLANHARHVLAHGLNPGEPIWVVRDNDGFPVVVEGNRRIASLKLMENPELADGTIVEKAFRELSAEFKKKPIREVEARVYPSFEAVRPWVAVRHMTPASGVGLQHWGHDARARASEAEGGTPLRHLVVRDFLDDESPEWEAIATALDSRWTTVDRVLNANPMHQALGVVINRRNRTITFENGDEDQGRALLLAILSEMAGDTFDFAHVEKKEDREAFLAKFAPMSVKAVAKPPQPAAPIVVSPAPAPRPISPAPKSVRPLPAHTARETLAPRTGPGVLKVAGARLNPLYEECRKIVVTGNENASALLLRVFIELSTEAMLKRRKVALPSGIAKRGKSDWSDIGIRLSEKIRAAADHLDPSGNAKEFQQARLAADESSRSNYAVWTLHGYFHNLDLIPQPTDLKGAWDAWSSYLRAVADDLQRP